MMEVSELILEAQSTKQGQGGSRESSTGRERALTPWPRSKGKPGSDGITPGLQEDYPGAGGEEKREEEQDWLMGSQASTDPTCPDNWECNPHISKPLLQTSLKLFLSAPCRRQRSMGP